VYPYIYSIITMCVNGMEWNGRPKSPTNYIGNLSVLCSNSEVCNFFNCRLLVSFDC